MKPISFGDKFTKKNQYYNNLKKKLFSNFHEQSSHNMSMFFFLLLFLCTVSIKNNFNSISIIVFLLYTVLNFSSFDSKKFKTFFPLYTLYFFSCISLLYTTNIDNGFKYILLQSPLLIFPFIFSTLTIKKDIVKKSIKFYVFWICILILYSEGYTVIKLLINDRNLFILFRKDYSYINLGNIIGIHPPYMVLQISFCVFYLLLNFSKSGINKILSIFILFLMFFYSIHLSSRLPLATLCVISFYIIFKKLMIHYSFLKALYVLLLSGIILSFLLYNVRSTRYRFQELFGMQYANGVYIESGGSKLSQWSSGFEANHSFLLGNGIGDANSDIIKSNLNNGLYKNAKRKYNAHNQYIQTFVELGLVGVLILIIFLVKSLKKGSNNFLKTTANAFFAYLLIVFMTESYLERHHGIVFISFICCLVNYKEP